MPDAYKKSKCVYCGKELDKDEPKIVSTDDNGEIVVCCEMCSMAFKSFIGGSFNGTRKGKPFGCNKKVK